MIRYVTVSGGPSPPAEEKDEMMDGAPPYSAGLASVLVQLGVTGVSTLVADADTISFAGFDLRRSLTPTGGVRPNRLLDVANADSFAARAEDGTLMCRGTFAGGAAFGCRKQQGWLRIFGLDFATLVPFRGPLRKIIDNPLLAMREYRVTSGHVVAGATVLRFECPILPLDALSYLG